MGAGGGAIRNRMALGCIVLGFIGVVCGLEVVIAELFILELAKERCMPLSVAIDYIIVPNVLHDQKSCLV